VHILLPPDLIQDLKVIQTKGDYLFLIGESENPHTASNLWRRRIKRMCQAAKILPDHPHRFRHYATSRTMPPRSVSVASCKALALNHEA